MFGIGFTEILLISIIAILFLGPDKLPETMVQIAKFIKGVKKTVGDAKGALEEEMKIADLKDEALSYKKQLDSATSELRSFKNIDLDDILDDEPAEKSEKAAEKSEKSEETAVIEQKNETVTLKKKSRKKREKSDEEKKEGKA
jgi:sec-independent protein translocase protein TatB